MGRPRTADRYEIDPITGCWNWLLSKNIYGYGQEWFIDRMRVAHKNYYENAYGPVPTGFELDHKCRNRGCVNPDHLEAVTDAENTRRGNVAKLTIEQVRQIRTLHVRGGVTNREIGQQFGVSKAAIQKIVSGINWVAA